MVSLLLLMCRRLCRGQASIVALIPCHKAVSLPLLWWRWCHWCAGIFAVVAMTVVTLIMMVLLPSLMCSWLHRCQASAIALFTHRWADMFALVVMAPLPSMHRRLCPSCNCNCCPHDDGVIAVVDAQAFLLTSSWHCCPRNNGIVTFDPLWRWFPLCNGIVAVLKLASWPLLQWHLCHHQCAGILTIITMVLLPLSQWHCCRWCAGIFAIITMASVAHIAMACCSQASIVIELASSPS